MRQGQQNRRGRGRGRKPQNPLGRNLESNGPDVKIRGNAAHIAEKYATLARDALATGDMVAGESYLQHAEHYNRIILANQAQQPAPNNENMNGANAGRVRIDGPGEEAQGNQPDVAADAPNASADAPAASADAKDAKPSAVTGTTQKAADQSAEVEKPARKASAKSAPAKSGNGADDAGDADQSASVAKSSKDEASDSDDADKAPDEAVT